MTDETTSLYRYKLVRTGGKWFYRGKPANATRNNWSGIATGMGPPRPGSTLWEQWARSAAPELFLPKMRQSHPITRTHSKYRPVTFRRVKVKKASEELRSYSRMKDTETGGVKAAGNSDRTLSLRRSSLGHLVKPERVQGLDGKILTATSWVDGCFVVP